MKKTVRLTAILLALLLLSSCAEQTPPEVNEPPDSSQSATETIADDYETRDLGNREFIFLNCPRDQWSMHCAIAPEEINGEPVNDLMFERNRYVEDLLNCTITETNLAGINDITEALRKSVIAGDDEYQIAYIPMSDGMTAISEKLIHELGKFDELQFDKPWWNQALLDSGSVGGKIYFAASSLHLMSIDGIWCMFFNQNMMDDLGLEYPYELVRQGKWTFDQMMKYCKAASNLNGDETFSPFSFEGNSVYGCVSIANGVSKYLYGAGLNYAVKDKDNLLVSNLNSSSFIGVLDKYSTFFGDSGIFMNVQASQDFSAYTGGITPYIAAFTQNRSLLIGTEVKVAGTLRVMDQPFGVLPFPKLDENQSGYRSTALNQLSVATIPVTADKPEDCALLLDLLSCESDRQVLDTFIANTIEQKGLRNDESIEMLRLIRDSLSFDPGIAFQIAPDLEVNLRSKLFAGDSSFASEIASAESAVKEKLAALTDKITE